MLTLKFPQRRTLLVLLFSTMIASPLAAQENSCLNRTIAVNILSVDGTMAQNLTAKDFRGKVRGKTVEFTSAALDAGPRRIVIVLDTTGSMYDAWGLEFYIAGRLLSGDADSSFALVTFSDRVDGRIGFDQGRAAVKNELARLGAHPRNPEIRTIALRDALLAAVDLLRPAQFGDAIYLISDGSDNVSKVSGAEFSSRWVGSGVRLFAVIPGAPPGRARTADEVGGSEWLQGYVTASGGDSIGFVLGDRLLGIGSKQLEAGTVTKLGQQIILGMTDGFDHEIARPYRVTIKLPEPLNKLREWDLNVLDAKGRINRNLRILYPFKLAPCP